MKDFLSWINESMARANAMAKQFAAGNAPEGWTFDKFNIKHASALNDHPGEPVYSPLETLEASMFKKTINFKRLDPKTAEVVDLGNLVLRTIGPHNAQIFMSIARANPNRIAGWARTIKSSEDLYNKIDDWKRRKIWPETQQRNSA